MKSSTITLILLACFCCKEITFESPQPQGKKALTSVPRDLRGKFLLLEGIAEPAMDTIIFEKNGYRLGFYDSAERARQPDPYDMGALSDTLVLKSYKGYYFFNFKTRKGWQLRVIRPERNGNLIYMDMGKEGIGFDDYLRELNSYVRVDSFKLDDNMVYRIDPTSSELVELIEKGFFSKNMPLTKIE